MRVNIYTKKKEKKKVIWIQTIVRVRDLSSEGYFKSKVN